MTTLLQATLAECVGTDPANRLGVGSIFFITLVVFLALACLTYINWCYLLKYKEQQRQRQATRQQGGELPTWSNHPDYKN